MRWCILALLAVPLLATPSFAAWPNQSNVNLPVCTAWQDQSWPAATSDGSGGFIVAWMDYRVPNYDIYAQHVLASGVVDPAWPADGRAVCNASYNQYYPCIASDGAGGALIAWEDNRSGGFPIYAQHILSTGVADPAWPANGRMLTNVYSNTGGNVMVSDGSGGAIVAWQDTRSGNLDIYAQHIQSTGVVDPAWPAAGLAVCTAANTQGPPAIATNGLSGAFIAWADFRNGTNNDIYAQLVLANGTASWPANGYSVCAAANAQDTPSMVSDGVGGAIVAWQDQRSGTSYDIYAHRLVSTPYVYCDINWPADGRAICTVTGDQKLPAVTADGAGGAVVAWQDLRGGVATDVYAQHVLFTGTVDGAWTADGVALCTATNNQNAPVIVSDAGGGAIVAWEDYRNNVSFPDIYAQHVLATGALDAGWGGTSARVVSNATLGQNTPVIATDGAGGALLAWKDVRSNSYNDIYAERVDRYGYLGSPEPSIAGVRDVLNDNGGQVKLTWSASYLDAYPTFGVNEYRVFRSAPARAALASERSRVTLSSDEAAATGRLLALALAGATTYWEYVGTQAAEALAGYSMVVSTTSDSMGAGNPRTLLMVEARAGTGVSASRWYSAPDSGYSVDNVPPIVPAPFTGQYAAGTTWLHWNPNVEPDLAGYRLYRGYTPSFTPGPGNLVAAPTDTGCADAAGGPAYYRLSAVDVHGNESPYAFLQPDGTVGVEPGAFGSEIAFARPAPNPAREGVSLRFALPREARVELAIFDPSGRHIRTLVSGTRAAGEHAPRWNLNDDAGRSVGAGLYFARLEVEGRRLVRRLAVTR